MDVTKKIEEFIHEAQGLVNDHYYNNYKSLVPPFLTVKKGKKYANFISTYDGHEYGSAWAFISLETGDVFKPASYKAPAKHARGNIFTSKIETYITAYGPNYLRG